MNDKLDEFADETKGAAKKLDTLAVAAGILLGLIMSLPLWALIIWGLLELFK